MSFLNSIVELCIVCNENTIFRNFNDSFGYFMKFRSTLNHFIRNTRQFYNKGLNAFFWIYKANKLVCDFIPIKLINSNLSDSLLIVFSTSCFYVENSILHINNFYAQ